MSGYTSLAQDQPTVEVPEASTSASLAVAERDGAAPPLRHLPLHITTATRTPTLGVEPPTPITPTPPSPSHTTAPIPRGVSKTLPSFLPAKTPVDASTSAPVTSAPQSSSSPSPRPLPGTFATAPQLPTAEDRSLAAADAPTHRPNSPSLTSLHRIISRTAGVKLTLINQTGAPLQIAEWPVAADDEGEVCPMQAWRGSGVVESTVPTPWLSYAHDAGPIDLGVMPLPEKKGFKNSHSEGWIYFDVLRPPPEGSMTQRPYRIHCQAYLRLSTSGNAPKTGLGRFDLDSSTESAMPSGSFGRIELVTKEREPETRGFFAHHRRTSSANSSSSADSRRHSRGSSVDHVDPASKEVAGDVVEVRYFLTKNVVDVRNDVDDSTKSGNLFLPTKDISVSSWASSDGARIDLLIHKEARYHELDRNLAGSKELRTSHHALDGFGTKTCWVLITHEGEQLVERYVKINPALGSAKGPFMVSTVQSLVHFDIERNITVNYGFFDAGISRAKELYIYASDRNTDWLGDLIREDERIRQVPFSQLALCGAHDAGMLGPIDRQLLTFIKNGDVHAKVPVIATALPFVKTLLGLLQTFKVETARILENMANTQKDTIPDQLAMGVRFFDYRPGFCLYDAVAATRGALHHQHAIVPGEPYLMFLINILDFLAQHPSEIVFVELKDDGFAIRSDIIDKETGKKTVLSMVPTLEELTETLEAARISCSRPAAKNIRVGSPRDLTRSIGDLLDSNMRLIIADRVHFPDEWERADSYTHEAYDTEDPKRVEAALKASYSAAVARSARHEGPAATIYQLQATPTAQIWADVGASLTYSGASSLLVWSKARMDRVTYPWVSSTTFVEPGTVIFLNDFVDGALVELALDKSKERCDIWLAKHHARLGTKK